MTAYRIKKYFIDLTLFLFSAEINYFFRTYIANIIIISFLKYCFTIIFSLYSLIFQMFFGCLLTDNNLRDDIDLMLDLKYMILLFFYIFCSSYDCRPLHRICSICFPFFVSPYKIYLIESIFYSYTNRKKVIVILTI